MDKCNNFEDVIENVNPEVGRFTLFLELVGYWFNKRHRNRFVICVVSIFTQVKIRGILLS